MPVGRDFAQQQKNKNKPGWLHVLYRLRVIIVIFFVLMTGGWVVKGIVQQESKSLPVVAEPKEQVSSNSEPAVSSAQPKIEKNNFPKQKHSNSNSLVSAQQSQNNNPKTQKLISANSSNQKPQLQNEVVPPDYSVNNLKQSPNIIDIPHPKDSAKTDDYDFYKMLTKMQVAPTEKPLPLKNKVTVNYWLQLAAGTNKKDLQNIKSYLNANGFKTEVAPMPGNSQKFRLVAGPYARKDNANWDLKHLRAMHQDGFIFAAKVDSAKNNESDLAGGGSSNKSVGPG